MRNMEEKFPRALWVRLVIYIAVGHVFGGFLSPVFEGGGK